MDGVLYEYLAHSNVDETWFEDNFRLKHGVEIIWISGWFLNFRKLDSALTVIRQDSCGKFLGIEQTFTFTYIETRDTPLSGRCCSTVPSEYYPPVYIIAKCLDYLRPSFLAVLAREDDNGNARPDSTVATPVSTPVSTPSAKKKLFKKINPFSKNSSDENKTKASPGNGSEQTPRYFHHY